MEIDRCLSTQSSLQESFLCEGFLGAFILNQLNFECDKNTLSLSRFRHAAKTNPAYESKTTSRVRDLSDLHIFVHVCTGTESPVTASSPNPRPSLESWGLLLSIPCSASSSRSIFPFVLVVEVSAFDDSNSIFLDVPLFRSEALFARSSLVNSIYIFLQIV